MHFGGQGERVLLLQVKQRQEEYQALHYGALQRLQQWTSESLHKQGEIQTFCVLYSLRHSLAPRCI